MRSWDGFWIRLSSKPLRTSLKISERSPRERERGEHMAEIIATIVGALVREVVKAALKG